MHHRFLHWRSNNRTKYELLFNIQDPRVIGRVSICCAGRSFGKVEIAGMPTAIKLNLSADYHQIHMFDEAVAPDFSESWSVKEVEDLLAVTPQAVALGTQSSQIKVAIHLRNEAPSEGLAQHLTECSLLSSTGRLVIKGCTDDDASAQRLEVPTGWLRVRAAHRNLGSTSREALQIWIWPAPESAAVVLKRHLARPPKKASKSNQTPKTAQAAALAARQGKLDQAMPILESLASQGDAAANASLAEILAFQFRWAEMVPHAQALLANPHAVRAGNVFTFMTRLLRRAAKELGQMEIIEQSSKLVPPDWAPMKNATLLKDVCPPSEYLEGGDAVAYETAAEIAQTNKRFRDRPKERGIYLLSIASNMRQGDEVLRHWETVKDFRDVGLSFEHLLSVLRWKLHKGQDQEAWETLIDYLHLWIPVDAQQVAPVNLLVDHNFRKFATAERCAQILTTPKSL